jgi:hypothetical protein
MDDKLMVYGVDNLQGDALESGRYEVRTTQQT